MTPLPSSIAWPRCGRDDRAAVGQRRVGDRELQRRGLQVALADGEVDVVARRPRRARCRRTCTARRVVCAVDVRLLRARLVLRVAACRATSRSGTRPGALARDVDARSCGRSRACVAQRWIDRALGRWPARRAGRRTRPRRPSARRTCRSGRSSRPWRSGTSAGRARSGRSSMIFVVGRDQARLSSAASAVIGLNVEPVGYADSVARLSSGAPVACDVRLFVGPLGERLARTRWRRSSGCEPMRQDRRRRAGPSPRRRRRGRRSCEAGDRLRCSAVVARLLQVVVERQLQPLALLRLAAPTTVRWSSRLPERVDDDPRVAVGAAQVLVVALLEPALADPRALGDARVLLLLELARADLATPCRTAARPARSCGYWRR